MKFELLRSDLRTPNARAREGDPRDGTGNDQMSERKKIDWKGIKWQYRVGQLSINLIADVYGCSAGAIRYQAKKNGWKRDLTKKVQEGIRAELVASEVATPNAREEEIVEKAAKIRADIIRTHQKRISRASEICEMLMDELKATSLSQDEIEAWNHAETQGEDGQIDF